MKLSHLVLIFANLLFFSFSSEVNGKTKLIFPMSKRIVIANVEASRTISSTKLFSLKVKFRVNNSKEDLEVNSLIFDARMPDHRHGMITSPKVVKKSKTEYEVHGVKLHMQGYWELYFTLETPGGERIPVVVPYVVK